MINPFCWLRFQRTRRAIADYPLYEPPNKGAEGSLRLNKIEENFAYFMAVRLERLSFFRRWLSDRFGVEAPLNGEGVLALEKWADRYSGGLIADGDNGGEVFRTYRPDWTGERCGYNVLVDVAIFLGEYLISKRPQLHWTLLRDVNGTCVDEKEESRGFTLGRPDLGGYAIYYSVGLFASVYFKALGSSYWLQFGGNRHHRIHMSFAWACRASHDVADHKDPRATFTFGNYSDGPL